MAISPSRLVRGLGGQDARFGEVVRRAQAILHAQFQPTVARLRDDYRLFVPQGALAGRAQVSALERRRREMTFLEAFVGLVDRANFAPLDQELYGQAVEHAYRLDVPLSVDWSAHDPELLRRFRVWGACGTEQARDRRAQLSPGLLETPAEIGDAAWVFFRGMGHDQVEGYFVAQKLDLWLERVIRVALFPLVAPLDWLVRSLRAPEPAPAPTASAPPQRGRFQRWLRRSNLRREGWSSLLRRSRLEEPTLREVVVLFRLRAAEGTDASIHIKTFRDVPLADCEMVFPKTTLRMRSFDLAVLAATSLAAIPALIQSVRNGAGASAIVVAVLALFAWRLVSSYRRVRREYAARLTSDLYEKNLDSSVGVLQWLADSVEEQELAEAILVYGVLLEQGPLDQGALDAAVERALRERFDLGSDFEVDDALRKVVDRDQVPRAILPLVDVRRDGAGEVFEAKPLSDALRCLGERWAGLLHEVDRSAA